MNCIEKLFGKSECKQCAIHSASVRLDNNCTLCKHYHYNNNINREKNEASHYCTNFVKMGNTIEYDCNKFEANARHANG